MNLRSELIANIQSALELIKSASGYNQNVEKVYRGTMKLPEQIPIDLFPCCLVVAGDETKINADVNSQESQFEIIVSCYLRQVQDDTDMDSLMNNLVCDVQKAVMVDPYRNGRAIDSFISRIVTDKMSSLPFAIADIYINIRYYHDRNNPSSQDNSPIP